jgi:(2R)-3-sulfolactate dehydrogenase (NADP+)
MIIQECALRELGLKIFHVAGLAENLVLDVVDPLVLAELDGISSHGFSRVPFYVEQIRSGKVSRDAVPVISQPAPAMVRVDACHGLAFPAIAQGLQKALDVARNNGVAMLGVTRSHHSGCMGHWVENMAREGLLALAFTNSPAAMMPWNGNKATFGTNPIAFGCPRAGFDPLVLDMALSKVARGHIVSAKQKGKTSIPEGWAVDAEGKPTTDPDAALNGAMAPMGDAKGAILAMMVEILAAAVNGANYGYEASSFFDPEGPAPGIGQTFFLLDVQRFNASFATQVQLLCAYILDQPGTRIPGVRRYENRAKSRIEGVNLPDALYAKLHDLACEA